MGEEGPRTYKRGIGEIRGKNKCGSKEAREVRYSGGKRL